MWVEKTDYLLTYFNCIVDVQYRKPLAGRPANSLCITA